MIPNKVLVQVVIILVKITKNVATEKSIPWLKRIAIIVDSVIIIPEGRKDNEPKTNEVWYICPDKNNPRSMFTDIKIK